MPDRSFRIRILKILKLRLEKKELNNQSAYLKSVLKKRIPSEKKKCLGFNRKIIVTFLQILGKIILPHSINPYHSKLGAFFGQTVETEISFIDCLHLLVLLQDFLHHV
uniref:Uncharacterized protein n=1 Tax=Micrurus corallinus TaxID=54390 RepID=A0A2D4FB12_MICCO